MGTPGAKPKLSAQRTSDDGKHPPGRVIEVTPPPELSPEAEEIWPVVVDDLASKGALIPADLPMLTEWVEAIALARAYRRRLTEVRKQDTVTEYDRNGNPHQVPPLDSKVVKRLRAGWKQAMDTVKSIAGDFGLTPADRMRLGLMDAAKGNVSLADALAAARDD